jgi:hypothetical protein
MLQTATSYLDRVLPAIDLVADRFVTLVRPLCGRRGQDRLKRK